MRKTTANAGDSSSNSISGNTAELLKDYDGTRSWQHAVNIYTLMRNSVENLEVEVPQLLKSRIKEAGLKQAFNPPGDGLCFYWAAGYQWPCSAETLRDTIFKYLKKYRYDVSILLDVFI